MRYVYMHNFRGFSETLVPIRAANFLVGENSTGKSSLLALLQAMSNPTFQLSSKFPLSDDLDLGGFDDLVSAWADDKSCFRIGEVTTSELESGERRLGFSIYTFANDDGMPRLAGFSQLADEGMISFIFENTRTRYRVLECRSVFKSERAAMSYFSTFVQPECAVGSGFSLFPKEIPAHPPLSIAISIMRGLQTGEGSGPYEFNAEIPDFRRLTWIAPIRTKPMRIYDGSRRGYSPEGEHIPLVLRRSLRSGAKSRRLARRLEAFGKASGLFEAVVPHSFGKGPQTPFEILVRFPGVELNISNVGYGVSQVLPLVVEFLTAVRGEDFAVQQPEVHLHPRAQAALGELLFELVQQGNHTLYVETHSDYLIDRFRLAMRESSTPQSAQVLFFHRTASGNSVRALPVSEDGNYPSKQPKEFRDFFIKEELRLLEL